MKKLISLILTLLLLCPSVALAQVPTIVLSNADVLQMVKAKIATEVILAKINSSRCNFDTFPPVLTELKYRGVPDEILLAMVNASNRPLQPKPAPAENVGNRSDTAPAARLLLRDGTDLVVLTSDEISSKTATEGDPVNFRVEEDVRVDNRVLIRAGTLVKGEVADVSKSGMFGKGGKLSIRVTGTKAIDGQRVRLRASKGKAGDNKTGATVALVVLFGVLGFLKKGKNAVIPAGTRVSVYVDDDVMVAIPAEAQPG